MKFFIHRLRRLPALICVICAICGISSSQVPNCGCEANPQINVLAVVNGTRITKQDLSIDAKTQVGIAQEAVVTARNLEVGLQINKLLLEAEAKRRGLTPEKLFEVEVKDKTPPPTDDQVKLSMSGTGNDSRKTTNPSRTT